LLQGKLCLSILIAKREGRAHQADLGAFVDEGLNIVVDALGAGSMGALPVLADLQGCQIGFIGGPILVAALESDLGGGEGDDDAVELRVVEAVFLDDEAFASEFVLVADL
jgi:hypothetical protein